MGEYAYDFTGENVHDGNAHNPHDAARMTGGSSSGSGGAVAGGLVPLSLGSDTNGSIRVPSSFCGLFGLKPTYGRLTRARSFPFVASLDHLGPLARSARDLALAYDAMQGPDPEDPVCVDRPVEPTTPTLARGTDGLRIAVAGGYFREGHVSRGLRRGGARRRGAARQHRRSKSPRRARARAAAYVITASEGASLHLDRLRTRADDFDPAMRDRLIAGAMIPAALVNRAQKFRRWYRARSAQAVRAGRRDPRARDALHGAGDRAEDLRARRRRAAGAAEHRHLHPADLVHRPAGRRRAGAAARRCRSACRSSRRRGGRTSRCESPMRSSRRACASRRGPRTSNRNILRESSAWRSTCRRSSPR